MYHPSVIDRRLSNMATSIRASVDPNFSFKEFSISEVEHFCAELEKIYDPLSGNLLSPLSIEGESFIRHEISRCKVDFLYWATRYAYIDVQGTVQRFAPRKSQLLLISLWGAQEEKQFAIQQIILKAATIDFFPVPQPKKNKRKATIVQPST